MTTLALLSVLAASPQPPELGQVPWLRDFEAAVLQARKTNKPLLVLFDEVPGCSTVLGFGEEVLSSPDVVKAITRDFVPVAVFNNVGGRDAEILKSFGEPSWNNPVVRIITADRVALAPRFAGPYTVEAFNRLLASARPALQTATLAAACFWECEARLGALEAVRASRVGFLEGEEVVEVDFDPAVMDRAALLLAASRLECAPKVFTRTASEQQVSAAVVGGRAVPTQQRTRLSEKDTKYFLRHSRKATNGSSEQELVRLNAQLRR